MREGSGLPLYSSCCLSTTDPLDLALGWHVISPHSVSQFGSKQRLMWEMMRGRTGALITDEEI